MYLLITLSLTKAVLIIYVKTLIMLMIFFKTGAWVTQVRATWCSRATPCLARILQYRLLTL